MRRPVLFLDDGGVMNDNRLRSPAWQRLVGEFCAPRLGGEPAAWAEANRVVATRQWEEYSRTCHGRVDADCAALYREQGIAWTAGMCDLVGVPAPPPDECLALAEQATAYVTPRVQAAFPGAVEAIRALHAQGYQLHTASGEWSIDLHGYLTGMGVRACFGRLYGPDLIDTLKEVPAYYARLFADAGVEPGEALVLDDSPLAIAWAVEAGARAVLIGVAGEGAPAACLPIGSLADLPALLAGLATSGGWLAGGRRS